ncbi:MAG: N-formylglutamate amidohydrolase [Methyloceanibacter sp.]|nr:N-formylglutamate amidohydrolase [Methyloceanibacter sp.]
MLDARSRGEGRARASSARQAAEERPYRRLDGDVACGLLLLCDHAANALPKAYGSLGLPPYEFHRHIAYDIGAAVVTERIAEALNAPALLTRYSRLLIDPNRGADDPTLIMQISDGAVVPGNATIDDAERQARIARYYAPYHEAIAGAVDAALATGKPPILVSVHSFTSAWRGVQRPWHVAVLWDKDPRLALPLLHALQALPGLVAGNNVPYSGQLHGDTLYQHGTVRGLAHVLIEVRQDLILTPEGQAEWGDRLADVLRNLMGNEEVASELHRVQPFGSYTHE